MSCCCCGKKTILVVDDDADARVFVSTVLSGVGDFDIIEAEDGDEAIAKAKEKTPALIVLDVMMPNKDGFQTFYELRQNESLTEIPVIMLTGVADQTGIKFSADDMKEYMGSPPAAFLDKPVDPDKLAETVKKVLAL